MLARGCHTLKTPPVPPFTEMCYWIRVNLYVPLVKLVQRR